MNKLQTALQHIATLWKVGFVPIAPGTAGTFVAFLFVIFFRPGNRTLLIITLVLLVVGTIAAHSAEKTLGKKDSGHIIIDEVVGYFVSILYVESSMTVYVIAFFLFRVFDILKPPPVNYVEKSLSGGLGVMMDDVAAGLYVNVAFQIATSMKF
ncbi:MAG: phosphatidylglycerophosphatase A [Nitrospirae bacterium]|nr:phosphatidylglycerophosphatase A [Nitrospirota bacterium]